MIDKPLVSVVIMTCNRQNMLKNAIETVFNQTYQPIELICILGMNSFDQSEEMLTELRAKNMIKFNKNFGNRIDARNKAFEMATGKYVCFLDDDDSMLNTRVQKQVEYLEAHPNVDIVGCSTMLNDKVGLMHTFKHLSAADVCILLNEGNDIDEVINFQSCMFRKESIDKAFGDKPKFENLFIAGGEGQFFLYNCIIKYNMVVENISDTIYVYYVGQADNSLSGKVDPVFYNEHLLGKPYFDKYVFVKEFDKNFNLEETTEAPTEAPIEKPKRGRKKKAEESATEAPTEAPKKRTRKNKAEEAPSEAPTEKPKRGHKKKAEESATEAPTEAPKKRGRKKKIEE